MHHICSMQIIVVSQVLQVRGLNFIQELLESALFDSESTKVTTHKSHAIYSIHGHNGQDLASALNRLLELKDVELELVKIFEILLVLVETARMYY